MNLESITQAVCELSKSTAGFILGEQAKLKKEVVETKGLNDFVTYVDKESERQLVEGLQALLPESGFIAEENTSSKRGELYNWIIDPLDGTTNFIHGVPCFCISIALQRGHETVLGVVRELNLDECFYAWEGSPAYLNGRRIAVSKAERVKDALLATGFPYYDYARLDEYMNLFRHLMQHSHGIRRPGSAAADLAYVACGRYDGFYEYSLKAWDVAAGAFLVQQAGGKNCDFSGGNNYLFGQEIISGNGLLFDEFAALVKQFMKA